MVLVGVVITNYINSMNKTVVGVVTMDGDDVLVFSDGSMQRLFGINGQNGQYVICVPVDLQTALKPEDINNQEFSTMPGYVEPAPAPVTPAPEPPVEETPPADAPAEVPLEQALAQEPDLSATGGSATSDPRSGPSM